MTTDTPQRPSLTIGLTGDVMLGRLVNAVIHEKGFAYPCGDMLPVFQCPDLLLINLECTLTGTRTFRDFARSVIDAGADVFWGRSAHIVHGLALWNGRAILYDTGGFVDDYAIGPELRNDLSALLVLEVCPLHVRRIELISVKIEDMQVNRARGGDRAWFIQRFAQLCAEMETEMEIADGSVSVRLAQPAEGQR